MSSIRIVCSLVCPRLVGEPALVLNIDGFIGVASHWTMVTACEKVIADGMASDIAIATCLPRVAVSESYGLDPLVKHQMFNASLRLAVHKGDLSLVQWLIEVYLPTGRVRDALYAAIVYDRVDIIQWLYKHHSTRVVWALGVYILFDSGNQQAIHPETARILHNFAKTNNLVSYEALLHGAASSGDLQLTNWGLEALEECLEMSRELYLEMISSRGVPVAAEYGCLDFIQWAAAFNPSLLNQKAMNSAIKGGHLDIVKWLYAVAEIDEANWCSLWRAARRNHWDVINWAVKHLWTDGDTWCFQKTLQRTIKHKQRAVILLIFARHELSDCAMASVVATAAGTGDVEFMKWLFQHQVLRSFLSLYQVGADKCASNGHLEALKWLQSTRKIGMTATRRIWNWDDNICYAVDKMQPEKSTVGYHAARAAANAGHSEVVLWILDQYGWNRSLIAEQAIHAAIEKGHIHIVKALHDEVHSSGLCKAEFIDDAASSGNLELIQWFHAHCDAGCTSKAMNNAVVSGHLHVVKWLYPILPDASDPEYVRLAGMHGHFSVVEWILSQQPEVIIGLRRYPWAFGGRDLKILRDLVSSNRIQFKPEEIAGLRWGSIEELEFLIPILKPRFPDEVRQLHYTMKQTSYLRANAEELELLGVW